MNHHLSAIVTLGAACCLAGLLANPQAPAADPPVAECLLRDGTVFAAALHEVTGTGVVVSAEPGGLQTLPLDELVLWGAFADRSQTTQVVLVDGSVLVADVLSVEADAVVTVGRLWQETRLPRAVVQAIVFHPPADPQHRDKLLRRAWDTERPHARLLLENGDELAGRLPDVLRPDAGAFQLTHIAWITGDAGQTIDVPVERLVAVLLTPGQTWRPAAGGQELLVGLRDGSLVHAQTMQQNGPSLELQLVAGPRIATEPFAAAGGQPWQSVVLLQPLRGHVTYLSDLPPLGYRHIPFLDMSWPYHLDRSVTGGRLRHGGRVWAKGLGMHSSARLAFETGGQYRELHAELALDDAAGRQGSVIFRVYVQGTTDDWNLAYESGVVRGGEPALPIRVDLQQAQRVALIVDYADRTDQWDHANWLNARLVR